jgi:hypothetical protein
VWADTHHESLHGAGKRLDADRVRDEERPRRPAAGPKIPLANRFGQGYAALSPRGNHGQGIDKRNVCESHAGSSRSIARKGARPQNAANGRHGIQLLLLHAHDTLLVLVLHSETVPASSLSSFYTELALPTGPSSSNRTSKGSRPSICSRPGGLSRCCRRRLVVGVCVVVLSCSPPQDFRGWICSNFCLIVEGKPPHRQLF